MFDSHKVMNFILNVFYIMAIIFEPHLQQKLNIIEIKHFMTLYLSPLSNRNWKLKVNGIYHNHIILNTFLILWGSIFSRGFHILCYTLNIFKFSQCQNIIRQRNPIKYLGFDILEMTLKCISRYTVHLILLLYCIERNQ